MKHKFLIGSFIWIELRSSSFNYAQLDFLRKIEDLATMG